MTNRAWEAIFEYHHITNHDFDVAPYLLSADAIKDATQSFKATGEREPRILCKQDTRESRPDVFKSLGIFVLPIKNGFYALIRGEGYVDLPPIESNPIPHISALASVMDKPICIYPHPPTPSPRCGEGEKTRFCLAPFLYFMGEGLGMGDNFKRFFVNHNSRCISVSIRNSLARRF